MRENRTFPLRFVELPIKIPPNSKRTAAFVNNCLVKPETIM